MKKCEICGKGYIANPNIPNDYPEFLKMAMAFIPACDCLEKEKARQLEEMEKQRLRECLENKIKKYRDISLLDKKFYTSTFANAEKSSLINLAYKYAKTLMSEKTNGGLYLCGGVGTGKTYASNCIANYLMSKGKTALVMNFGLYLNKIQLEWTKAESDILEYVKSCDLLVIDDLGVEALTPWKLDKIFALVDTRYRTGKAMVITSNLPLNTGTLSIESKFGSRIADRLAEMCYQYSATGESRRKFDRKEFEELLKQA